jgi:hypothetical protein
MNAVFKYQFSGTVVEDLISDDHAELSKRITRTSGYFDDTINLDIYVLLKATL